MNISLIGMPGSGKTTIGRCLACKLSYNFIDLDSYIEEKSGKVINDIFNGSGGEEEFRILETEALLEISSEDNSVIATGGGIIKVSRNIQILKMRCFIVFIDRPVEKIIKDIDFSVRPLLAANHENIYKLYDERYNIYKTNADLIIKNDESIESAADKIILSMKNQVK